MSGGFDAIRMQAAHVGLFETPILHGRLAGAQGLDRELAQTIRAKRALEPGVGRSNVGGWHSATDMLAWGGEGAAKLADLATKAAMRLSTFEGRDSKAFDWSVKMWANVSPPGALNMSHAHPGVLWAAVYYVDMGAPSPDAEDGGELFFEDPRFPVPLMRMPGFRMLGIDGQPQVNERRWPTQAGDLMLFPAWLRHGVRPHGGTGERISVAMNIDVAG